MIKHILKIVVIIIAFPLLPFLLLLFLPFFFSEKYQNRKKRKIWEKEHGYVDGEKRYLVWSDISGAGTLKCKECGEQIDVIGFTHGIYSCNRGVQCQHCGTFFTEYNEGKEYHKFGLRIEDVVCPNCGKVYERKDEPISLDRKEFLFCPKCKSKHLKYHMSYIT